MAPRAQAGRTTRNRPQIKIRESREGYCRDGCGAKVAKMFVPGHDQKLLSRLRQAVVNEQITSDEAMAEARSISAAFAKKVSRSMAAIERSRSAALPGKRLAAGPEQVSGVPAPAPAVLDTVARVWFN